MGSKGEGEPTGSHPFGVRRFVEALDPFSGVPVKNGKCLKGKNTKRGTGCSHEHSEAGAGDAGLCASGAFGEYGAMATELEHGCVGWFRWGPQALRFVWAKSAGIQAGIFPGLLLEAFPA